LGKRIDGRQLCELSNKTWPDSTQSQFSKTLRVAIIHFEAPSTALQSLTTFRIEAAKVSTRAKLKTFSGSRVEPVDLTKPWIFLLVIFVATLSNSIKIDRRGNYCQHPMPPDFQVHFETDCA
jgi:hypothetical protein